MVFSLWICSKNDVVFAFLHFVLYFSSNLRMIQGWINLHMSEFKTKLGNVDNACTECVLYNMRSYKYKCLEKFATFFWCKVPLHGNTLAFMKISLQWLLRATENSRVDSFIAEFTHNGEVSLFLLAYLDILELELQSRLLYSL